MTAIMDLGRGIMQSVNVDPQKRLGVGDQAPMFTLPSSLGQPVSLRETLANGPVVLAWYLFDFGRV